MQGHAQKMWNISVLQTLTWLASIALCVVCMMRTIAFALTALGILIFSRTMLVAGSQALVAAVFPPRFIGSLLGVMWTVAGLVSFAVSGLVRLSPDPQYLWRVRANERPVGSVAERLFV